MRTVLLEVLLFYIALGLYGLFFSEGLIFQPRPSSYREIANSARLKLTSADGSSISAVYLLNPLATHTLLFSHGNAEDLETVGPFLQILRNIGFSVLSYDYPGYGSSTGKVSEKGAYAAVDAAYHYLIHDLKLSPQSIIAHGRSLGGGVAADLASRHEVGGLILESTFLSAYRVMTRFSLYPFDAFNTYAKLKNIKSKVLVIHGKLDEVIPFYHGEQLFAKLKDTNQAEVPLWIDNAHHNDIWAIAPEAYIAALKEFKALCCK
ncbi:MAG: alpha/beta hydrolase [Pseudomonadota bacterium]